MLFPKSSEFRTKMPSVLVRCRESELFEGYTNVFIVTEDADLVRTTGAKNTILYKESGGVKKLAPGALCVQGRTIAWVLDRILELNYKQNGNIARTSGETHDHEFFWYFTK